MMTFYAAAGSYKMITEGEHRIPYILIVGKLHCVSVPEFIVWTSALWQVLSYEELNQKYKEQTRLAGLKVPDLDEVIQNLVRRKLLLRGEGYTGRDALYNMLGDSFISPTFITGREKLRRTVDLLRRKKISLHGFIRILASDHLTADEKFVLKMVRQTPLNSAELICCLDKNIRDISTPAGMLGTIYKEPGSTESKLVTKMGMSANATRVLEAVSSLYLKRYVMLERV